MNEVMFIILPHITYDKFVNPGFNERTIVKIFGNYGSAITGMPIGLISLSAYLKKHVEEEIKL